MYLHTSLDRLVSWLRAAMHHWTTSLVSTSWFAEGFIWYLWSAHFMHVPAPSCSPFPWPISKKFQQCLCWKYCHWWQRRRHEQHLDYHSKEQRRRSSISADRHIIWQPEVCLSSLWPIVKQGHWHEYLGCKELE